MENSPELIDLYFLYNNNGIKCILYSILEII